MKNVLFLFVSIFTFLSIPTGHATELGVLFGGSFNIEDGNTSLGSETFNIGIYTGTSTESTRGQGLGFFMPLNFGFATDTPAGTDGLTVELVPTAEYDVNLWEEKLFLTPGIGLSFMYLNGSGFGTNVNVFQLGFNVMAQLKYQLNHRLLIRFAPFSMLISPWRYADQGIGSDSSLAVNYNIFVGSSYLF